MPQQQAPWLEGKYGWNFGEGGWNSGMDQNLLKFSFMFDKNVDSIVASLPAAVNGQSHYLTTDNRLYFAVGTTYFSTPVPKWFTIFVRSTGQTHQFNGTSLVQIDSPAQLDTRLDAVELTVASLGTAAFEDVSAFATQVELDIVEAQGQTYTDALRTDLASDVDVLKGAALVGYANRTVATRLDEIPSPMNEGAVGDGVTNDTAAFKTIEAGSGTTVDLAGKTYAVTSIWVDAINGALLTKDYRNGKILLDGRAYTQDLTEGAARSGVAASSRLIEPSTTKRLGVQRVADHEYHVWRPLGGQYWQRSTISRSGAGIPFNWQATWLKQVLGYFAARDAGVTYTGGWATDDANTALTSDSATAYISGRAQQSITPGDYVEISYTGGGDLYIVFTGRTSSNFVNVLLDSGKEYLVLPDDGAGNRYFDSYTAVDLIHRQIVKIASGVPEGAHTIRLTVSASKNPSSSGGRFVFNALAFDSENVGPWIPETDAPQWVTGKAILKSQVRKNAGRYYYASANGTTGATAPTHATGSVSDGGVTWIQRDASGYDLIDNRIQAEGSQLEYAYEIKPAGATTREDVGGVLHGNESQTAFTLAVDATAISLINFAWGVGESVSFNESLTVTHSEIDGGSTPVVLTKLSRSFDRSGAVVRHQHTLQMAAEVGYFYNAMWPLLHYDGPKAKYAVRRVWSPCDGYRACSDFYGQLNPIIGRTKDLVFVCEGDAYQADGSGGVPTATAAPVGFVAWMSVDRDSVNAYSQGNRIFAGKAMNTSGADASSGGSSSMVSKLYFERYSTQSPVSLPLGEVIECVAKYGLALQAAR